MRTDIAQWVQHEQALSAFANVAGVLRDAQVPFAPIKGVILARSLYRDVVERPLRDVDLLVSRGSFERAADRLKQSGFPCRYLSVELGEAVFEVGGFAVELHSEVARRDLMALNAEEVLLRAREDSTTFPFLSLLVDDVDHLLVLAGNVVKDYFAAANPHQAEDLDRMLARLDDRLDVLIERATRASFLTGLWAVASWMHTAHGSGRFARVLSRIGRPPRSLQANALALASRSKHVPRAVGLPVACWTNDDFATRAAASTRLARRGLVRQLGGDPDSERGLFWRR